MFEVLNMQQPFWGEGRRKKTEEGGWWEEKFSLRWEIWSLVWLWMSHLSWVTLDESLTLPLGLSFFSYEMRILDSCFMGFCIFEFSTLHYHLLMFWLITRLTPLSTESISFTHEPSAGLALCQADTFLSCLFHLHPHPQARDTLQGHPRCWKNNLIPVYLSHLNVKSAHPIWIPFDPKGLRVELWYLVITGSFRAGRPS